MAKPDISKLYSDPEGNIFREGATSLTGMPGLTRIYPVKTVKKVLIRTARDQYDKNTPLNIETPGPDWDVEGDSITIPNSGTFTDSISVFYNGALLLNGPNAAAKRDVYFSGVPGAIAFEFNLKQKTVLQIWKFPPS